MNEISPQDLKSILHSKRANIYYLEHCRVLVKDGRVEYVTEQGKDSLYWNIPIANTTSILLGTGTSITQQAVRELSRAGVLLGFSGGGGTPLYSANEVDVEVAWFLPQSEYRPTEYLQQCVSFWFNEDKRLEAAKMLQLMRLDFLDKQWKKLFDRRSINLNISELDLSDTLVKYRDKIPLVDSNNELLLLEASLTKILYRKMARSINYGDFKRMKGGSGIDPANRFLDNGNYLAYGLGATATWVLGLPHGLSVLHGKTGRGALVFDAADLIKVAIILPQAFISANVGHDHQEFRDSCIDTLTRSEALDFIIESLKTISTSIGNAHQ